MSILHTCTPSRPVQIVVTNLVLRMVGLEGHYMGVVSWLPELLVRVQYRDSICGLGNRFSPDTKSVSAKMEIALPPQLRTKFAVYRLCLWCSGILLQQLKWARMDFDTAPAQFLQKLFEDPKMHFVVFCCFFFNLWFPERSSSSFIIFF